MDLETMMWMDLENRDLERQLAVSLVLAGLEKDHLIVACTRPWGAWAAKYLYGPRGL